MSEMQILQFFMFILNISYSLAVITEALQKEDFCIGVILKEKIASVQSKAHGPVVLCSSCRH